MNQQINFLKNLPKEPIQLPAQWIAIITAVIFGLVILTSVFMGIQQVQNSFAITRATKANAEATEAYNILKKNNPLLASGINLSDQITALKKELRMKKDYYATLTRTKLRYGFSNYLDTFSTIVPEGVWLTDFIIDQGGPEDMGQNDCWMRGNMINPSGVAALLHGLQNLPMFEGSAFRLFYARKPTGKSYSEFKITNMPLTADEAKLKDDTSSRDDKPAP